MSYFAVIRRAPRPLIEAAYRGLEALDAVSLAIRNLRRGAEPPLPPMRLRARVGSRGADAFLSAGRRCADALRRASAAHLGTELTSFDRILDFGCGVGRTLRHFAPKEIEGCDVDAEAIAWMQQNIGTTRFAANRFEPPLPWPDETFGLVYSVSIFTHLDEKTQLAWLAELARVLRPGGCALLTVQSEHALSMFLTDAIYSTASMKSRLAARGSLEASGGFVFEPYEVNKEKFFPGVTEYGLAFHSRAYLDRAWSPLFDVAGVDVGSVDGLQDVVALRKRQVSP
jgi:SAM-dependent methyltransferase